MAMRGERGRQLNGYSRTKRKRGSLYLGERGSKGEGGEYPLYIKEGGKGCKGLYRKEREQSAKEKSSQSGKKECLV